jgi:glycosyltransferase involved in cell wall biosynthesis
MAAGMNELKPDTLISVIIPCYKGERWIGEAIESVLAQSYPHVEVIVVDDGSPDDSASVVRPYLKDARVHYIYQDNQGVAVARNRGIRQSRGSCLVFLDQDDRLLPHALEVGLQAFRQHPDCGFVFGQCYLIDAKGAPLIYSSLERATQGAPACTYEALVQGKGAAIYPPSIILFRRSILEQVGGFNPDFGMADDYEVYLKVARQAPIYFHGAVIVAYRQHDENNSLRALQMRDDALRVIEAQKFYLAGHPRAQAAIRAGKEYWRYCFTVMMIHRSVQHLVRGRWDALLRLGSSLVKLPTFPLSLVFYWLWWSRILWLRLKVRSVQSTEQLLSLMQANYNLQANYLKSENR